MLNRVIAKNTQLSTDDQLIFEPFLTGAIPGKYTLYFSTILKEPDYQTAESFSDLTNYVGETSNYQSKIFTGNILRIIYIVECKEECKSCSRLNSETNFYCVTCKDEYPFFLVKIQNVEVNVMIIYLLMVKYNTVMNLVVMKIIYMKKVKIKLIVMRIVKMAYWYI